MAIVWTHYWGGTDDGTTLKGIDLRNIQDDLANVTDVSAIGVTVQAYDEDLDNLSSPENVSTLNLVENGAFDLFSATPKPDNWTVEGGGTEAQETADVRVGENAYSITSDADGSASRQTIFATIDGSENSYWRGKDVTLAALVYATDASNARIQLDDGVTTSESNYHTGTTGWELLTITHTLSATATKLDVVLMVDGNAQEGIFDAVRLNHGKSTWQFARSPLESVDTSTFDVLKITERASGPSTIANEGAIYTKEVNGTTELFYRGESTGTEIQLTNGGVIGKEVFTSDGTWSSPEGITKVYLTMIGAGGAGATVGGSGGGGGGAGEHCVGVPYTVTPSTTYTIQVGVKASAGSSNAGEDTIFDTGGTGLTARGGNGGAAAVGGAPIGEDWDAPSDGSRAGGTRAFFSMGAGGGGINAHGAGGGGSVFGRGGQGGQDGVGTKGYDADENSGAGGGGSADGDSNGSNPGDGLVIVWW